MGQLEEIQPEVIMEECQKHGRFESKRIAMPMGGYIQSTCQKCREEEAIQQKKEDEYMEWRELQIRVTKNFDSYSLPKRFANKSFAEYKTDSANSVRALNFCKKYADTFAQRKEAGGGLVLCGKAGTGKTHLVSAIINQLESEKYISVFMSAVAATRHVKATYSRDSMQSESDAIRNFQGPDLLVLDEVGVQFGTDAEKLILFEIINMRYQNVLPTILISNLTLEELESYIGERVVDRMHEGGGAVLSFDWESYRRRSA